MKIRLISVLFIIALIISCISTPPEPDTVMVTLEEPAPEPAVKDVEEKEPASNESVVHDENLIERMGEYLENGKEKVTYGSFTEGIKLLVAVLAERENLEAPSAVGDELANEAEIELGRIKAALVLEADTVWIDKSGNQLSGSSINLFPQPGIILTIDLGIGRSLVSNAPVFFQFVSGGGALTAFVNTNEYGQAACKILSLDNDMEENVIRASLMFREKGYTYKFEGLDIDFVYMPPSNRAAIFVMEKSSLGVAEDPVIFQPVFDNLNEVAFDFSMTNSILDPSSFNKIYRGDKNAILQLGLEEDVPYIVVVLNDCFNTKELTFGDTPSGLFYSESRATIRIIRVADGKILYQFSTTREKSKNTHGQGGSEKVAVKHALDLVAVDMGQKLSKEIENISDALTGGE